MADQRQRAGPELRRRAPGRSRARRSRARRGSSAALISTGGGMSRPRPLAVEQRLRRRPGRRRRRRCRRRCRWAARPARRAARPGGVGGRRDRAPSRSSSSVPVGGGCSRGSSSLVTSWAVIVPVARSRSAADRPGRGGRVRRSSGRSPRRPPAPTRPARRRARRRPRRRAASSARPRALEHADRVEPVVAGEQRQVRVVVAGLGGDRLPGVERDVRRVADDDVDRAGEVGERRRPCRRAAGRRRCRRGCARPSAWRRLVELDGVHARRRAPRRRPPCAIAPEPVHRSTTHRARSQRRRACSIAQPASSSVSGRGTKTPGPTASSTWRKRGRAGQVLERLAGGAAGDQRVVRLGARASVTSSTSGSRAAVGAEDVGEQRRRRRRSGLATPASREPATAAVSTARAGRVTDSSASSRAAEVGLDAGVDDRLEVAVEHLVEVVGLVAGAVVGDAVLRRSCRCGSARSGRRCGPGCGGPSLASASASSWAAGQQPGPQDAQRLLLFCSWLFSFWQLTTMPVGRWVIRTAESVVLTLWPPGPLERNTSMRRSFSSIVTSTCSASGITSTPAAVVCTRPCDSVTGTRWTRCTPPSNLSRRVRRLAGLGRALRPSPRR